jgi:hypothetical protein
MAARRAQTTAALARISTRHAWVLVLMIAQLFFWGEKMQKVRERRG